MPAKANSSDDRVSSGRHAVPVVRNFDAAIPPGERVRLATLAAKLLRNEPSIGRTDVFGTGVFSGLTEAPALLLGDQREIGQHAALPVQAMEHRIAFLAAKGDFLAV